MQSSNFVYKIAKADALVLGVMTNQTDIVVSKSLHQIM